MSVSFDQVVRDFAPSRFAAVMGTGVLALGAAALGRCVSGGLDGRLFQPH